MVVAFVSLLESGYTRVNKHKRNLMKRKVFYLSDSTGLTAENLGKKLVSPNFL